MLYFFLKVLLFTACLFLLTLIKILAIHILFCLAVCIQHKDIGAGSTEELETLTHRPLKLHSHPCLSSANKAKNKAKVQKGGKIGEDEMLLANKSFMFIFCCAHKSAEGTQI